MSNVKKKLFNVDNTLSGEGEIDCPKIEIIDNEKSFPEMEGGSYLNDGPRIKQVEGKNNNNNRYNYYKNYPMPLSNS